MHSQAIKTEHRTGFIGSLVAEFTGSNRPEDRGIENSHELVEYLEDIDRNFPGRFDWLDGELKCQLTGWIKAGLIAYQIKLKSLWKQGKYKSFANYCEKSLGRSGWYINRLIDGAKLVLHLIQNGACSTVPTSEAQARPLVNLFKKEPDRVLEMWESIVDSNEASEITAKVIQRAVDPSWEDKQLAQPLRSTNQRAKKLADEYGVTIDEFLNSLMDEHEGLDEHFTPEREARHQGGRDPVVEVTEIEKDEEFDSELAVKTVTNSAARQIERVVASVGDQSVFGAKWIETGTIN